jgi:SAM-dependent methyltransferase
LPFSDGTFDCIVAARGVFRYLEYARALGECARVLRRGGRLGIHQFAASTWSPRAPWRWRTRASADAGHLGDLAELTEPADRAGLRLARARFWRTTRIYPYAFPVPAWLPGGLWSHCVAVFEKAA